jgi:hypothetical protein
MPTTHEKSFFEDILSFESKGWRVAIPDGIEPGSIHMGELRVHVYVVDVPGGQFWRGAITSDEFLKTLEHCKAQNSTNASRVIATVERMRRYESFAEGEDSLVREIITLGAWAFTGSRTLELAQERHGLHGHWLMLYYATKNGNYINRPVFVSESTGGSDPMPPATLLLLIRQIVSADTQDMGSSMAAALDDDGGAVVHERFTS